MLVTILTRRGWALTSKKDNADEPPMHGILLIDRRAFLSTMTLGSAALALPSDLVAALLPTPRQSAGPFYPSVPPLEADADLLRRRT